MPFKSLAQEGYLHAHPEILGKKGLAEWDAATKGRHLPDKKKSKERPKHTHIEHHGDGSHTTRHTMHDGTEHSAAHADDDAMMEHMQGMMGGSEPAEPEAPPAAASPMAAQ